MKRMLFVTLCVWAVVNLCSCRTQKQSIESVEAETARRDTMTITHRRSTVDWRRALMTWAADSLSLRIACDSVVTPTGTIYNPVIEAGVAGAKSSQGEASASCVADSVRKEAASRYQASSRSESDRKTEAVAVHDPPDLGWIAVAAGILLAIYVARRLK